MIEKNADLTEAQYPGWGWFRSAGQYHGQRLTSEHRIEPRPQPSRAEAGKVFDY